MQRVVIVACIGLLTAVVVDGAFYRPGRPPCGVTLRLDADTGRWLGDHIATYRSRRVRRVVGGEPVARGQVPWQAGLYEAGKHTCGGALVHPRFVLTAAHCVRSSDPAELEVLYGHNALYGGRRGRVERVVVHPLHNKLFARAYDFALLQLDHDAQFDDAANAVCLPVYSAAASHVCVATGWGRTTKRVARADRLHAAPLPLISPVKCNGPQHYPGMVHLPTMMCAGYEHGGVDACQGDSGGPLVCRLSENAPWQLHGIISWGFGCALPNNPGVYAKVLTVKGWIIAMISKFDKL